MYPEMVRRVRLVAGYLADHPDAGLPRHDLARVLSSATVRITGPGITNMWPHIAREVRALGFERGEALWPVRPDERWGWMCSAMTTPEYAVWVARQRELQVIGRMRRDLNVDGTVNDLLTSGLLPRGLEREVARSIDRMEDHLAAFDRYEAKAQAEFDALVLRLRALPRIS